MKPYPTQAQLKEMFDYNPDTGFLYWKICSAKNVKIGDRAGHFDSDKYISVSIQNKYYYAHRIAWIICYGEIPEDNTISHFNGNRYDNRLVNLKLKRPFRKKVRTPTAKEITMKPSEEKPFRKKVRTAEDIIRFCIDNNQFNITPLFLISSYPITRVTAGRICAKLQELKP